MLLFFVGFISSCKSTKDVAKTTDSKDLTTYSADQLVSLYEQSALTFDDAEVKAKVNYSDEKRDLTVKMTVRIEWDKQIWISAGLFGFEGVRALITPDSVFVINRIEKTYYQEPISKFEEISGLPVDFDMLQRLLTAQLLVSSQSSWGLEKENEQFKLISQLANLETIALFSVPKFQLDNQHVIDKEKSRELEIDYSNYQPIDRYLFPYTYQIHVSGEDELWLDFNITDLELNNHPDFSFSISKAYKREEL